MNGLMGGNIFYRNFAVKMILWNKISAVLCIRNFIIKVHSVKNKQVSRYVNDVLSHLLMYKLKNSGSVRVFDRRVFRLDKHA